MPTEVITSLRDRRSGKAARFPSLAEWIGDLMSAAGSLVLRHKAASLAVMLMVTSAVVVSWNALLGQNGPHPYPMFGARLSSGNHSISSAAAPLPVSRPKDLSPTDAAPPGPSMRNTPTDPIGDLIRTPEIRSSQPADVTKGVAAAQRMLTRLGYGPLKSDGRMGQGTRAALERFERDNKLPVTGALGPRTGRLLAAEAGVVLE